MAQIICGVDVSSQSLVAHVGLNGPAASLSNTVEGIAELGSFGQQHGVELVVMEATGGYEQLAFELLWAQGLPVAVVNPRFVRRYAESMGYLEKTDDIDGGVIADFAATKHVVSTRPASAEQSQLKALVRRLRQLTEMHTMERNRCRLVTDRVVLKSFEQLLAEIKRQIRELETAITKLIAADPLWRQLDQAFRGIKGVADRTVARLMAELPEIGVISNKAISKLVGLAPLAQDSGKHHGPRSIAGGRRNVRAILFIVASLVRRHDRDFAAFDQRLKAAGKPKKVILVALAHKLLVRLNAKARGVRRALSGITNCALAAAD